MSIVNTESLSALARLTQASNVISAAAVDVFEHANVDGIATIARNSLDQPIGEVISTAAREASQAQAGAALLEGRVGIGMMLRGVADGHKMTTIGQRLVSVADQLEGVNPRMVAPRAVIDSTRLLDDARVIDTLLREFIDANPGLAADGTRAIQQLTDDIDTVAAFAGR